MSLLILFVFLYLLMCIEHDLRDKELKRCLRSMHEGKQSGCHGLVREKMVRKLERLHVT